MILQRQRRRAPRQSGLVTGRHRSLVPSARALSPHLDRVARRHAIDGILSANVRLLLSSFSTVIVLRVATPEVIHMSD